MAQWLERKARKAKRISARRHDPDEELGVAPPEGLKLEDGILVVPWDGREPERRLAYKTARLVQKIEGYEFCSFPPPGRSGGAGEREWMRGHRLRAYLMIKEGRAVGYALAVDTTTWRQNRLLPSGGVEEAALFEGGPLPLIGPLYVLHTWRGQGLGRQLVVQIALDMGLPQGDVVGEMPMTDAGIRLASSLRDDGTFLST